MAIKAIKFKFRAEHDARLYKAAWKVSEDAKAAQELGWALAGRALEFRGRLRPEPAEWGTCTHRPHHPHVEWELTVGPAQSGGYLVRVTVNPRFAGLSTSGPCHESAEFRLIWRGGYLVASVVALPLGVWGPREWSPEDRAEAILRLTTVRRALQAAVTQLSRLAKALLAADSEQASSQASSEPRQKEPGEARPKGTEEVLPDALPGTNKVHGGDGASGEVPDASGPGAGPQEGAGSAPSFGVGDSAEVGGDLVPTPSRPPSGSASAEAAHEGDARSDGNTAGEAGSPGAAGEPEGTGGPSDADGLSEAHLSDQVLAEIERLFASAPELSREETAGGEQGEPSPAERRGRSKWLAASGRRAATSSTSPKWAHGGIFASPDDARVEQGIVDRARRALAALINERGEGEAGPRWDARKLSTRILTWRLPTPEQRREESGRPAILLLADVSGSMSAFSLEVVRLALAIPQVGTHLVVAVIHSNGFPEWVIEGGIVKKAAPQSGAGDWYQRTLPFYQSLLHRYDIAVAVAAGDWDAAWVYSWLTNQNIDLYWLDVYASRAREGRISTRVPDWVRERLEEMGFDVRRVHYAYGCRDAEGFCQALEALAKKGEAKI